MQQTALTIAAILLAMTMCVHSAIGQRRIIRPLLNERAGVMKHPLARFIVPFAWHLTSGIGLVLAAILFAWAWAPDQARTVGLAATGMVFIVSGLIDAVGSKAKHIGWAPLVLIGLSALVAVSAQATPTDAFGRYPAKLFKGRLVNPQEDWPEKQHDLAQGINFGGHFTLVGVPCGTACAGFFFVDRRTGKVVRAPDAPEGLEYERIDNRADSNLIKVLWVSATVDGTGETLPSCFRQNYVWTGVSFRSLSRPLVSPCPAEVTQP